MNYKKILTNLIKLQIDYANTPRTVVTVDRIKNIGKRKNLNFKDVSIREPLIEHVGHLPIIASYLHPYIEHSKEVKLGRSLIMLSIHDIGETVTGDIFSHSKGDEDTAIELKHALSLVNKDLRSYILEFEERETLDAKYAKSIDSLAPILTDIALKPNIMLDRFKVYSLTSSLAEKDKRKYFDWDSVLNEIFNIVIEELKARENLSPSILT
jgi:5'-deoxynucleotidase YfbR-like HD superfamily hydrolase